MAKGSPWIKQIFAVLLTLVIIGLVLLNTSDLDLKDYVRLFDASSDISVFNAVARNPNEI